MPPRRMRNNGQDMRNPFGMRQPRRTGSRNGFGMQQQTGLFGQGQAQPFQFRGPTQNQGFNFGGNQRPRGRGAGKGGLLAKFLKKGENNNGGDGLLQQFTRGDNQDRSSGSERSPQAAGGILQTLLNPGNVNSFLSNTQQVLQSAQQLGPMFQQYGPMVKNIPSLWKLYRGLQDMSADETETPEEENKGEDPIVPEAEAPVKKKKKKKPPVNTSEDDESDDERPGPKPKLYI
ncbi:VrrA/YqfQ family protein [Bacillus sp. KH172YL63]|uniref:VrrA/YqfQ family protein n=1 Tax=Bacillus sp. KH172YL63 TaxID=2709784 RepID=UPI0013E4AD25|nr:VrrA/YqfQ family protein [Bacillus sp. KH172YL63]BCB04848.1 hypothetical protein KH172YL63_29810 [Bacillus sp. KH172YL63]